MGHVKHKQPSTNAILYSKSLLNASNSKKKTIEKIANDAVYGEPGAAYFKSLVVYPLLIISFLNLICAQQSAIQAKVPVKPETSNKAIYKCD